ncbi:unnamed protein product [[Candida] boidinii]|uniref:ER membrane protein complex subunit 2 n=1 Tax=Candida boidinii TaxID=5477 RepID=A0A9W6WJE2_CANBO|nr:hypothetical protein B5S33_g2493 [[Candida] boidinii]GME75520.1 unnamed protein product [[Candida] boidinii]
MDSFTDIRDQLLTLHRTGKFTRLNNNEIDLYYQLNKDFLNYNSNNNKITEFEKFTLYELQFYLSIFKNEDIEAKIILDKLNDKFDSNNSERLIILKSIYLESISNLKDEKETIRQVIQFLKDSQFEIIKSINKSKATNVTSLKTNSNVKDLVKINKRILILSKNLLNRNEYIVKLNEFLNDFPLEFDIWYELSINYEILNQFDKSIYCLQEILLNLPFNYNLIFKIGELYFKIYLQNKNFKSLIYSIKNYIRVLELCENNFKSLVNLNKSIDLLISLNKSDKSIELSDTDLKNYEKINEIAINKLKFIKQNELTNDENLKILNNKVDLI